MEFSERADARKDTAHSAESATGMGPRGKVAVMAGKAWQSKSIPALQHVGLIIGPCSLLMLDAEADAYWYDY